MRRQMAPQPDEVIDYFENMTVPYLRYGGESLALHTGLFDSSVMSKQDALLRSNDLLIEDLKLSPGQRILDAGCGLGGLVIHLAKKYRVRGIGITLCPSHVEIANQMAAMSRVDRLVEFHCMDYMDMQFPEEHFDAILSQDAFCHAPDMEVYFSGIHRILKPGGYWRAIDAFRNPVTITDELSNFEKIICQGWKTAIFPSREEVRVIMESAGFEDVHFHDLSPLAETSAKDFIREKLLGDLAAEFQDVEAQNLDWRYKEHMAACAAFGAGVLDGTIKYMLVGGRKI